MALKSNFWGEHSVILAWYVNLEDIENEISEIANAIQNGEIAYELKYYAEVENGAFGSPKPVSYTHLTLPTILRV